MILSLVLTGIVMSALFEAGISLMKYVADPYSKLPAITFWLMGSLAAVVPSSLPLLVIPLVIGLIPLILLKWRINLLSLPDEEALAMGINITRMRIIVIVCATLITSSIVAVGGLIGWVGLIIPHMARIVAGPDFRKLLPASLLMGSTFLLLVDDIARGATSMEIPLGILTAAVGAPFFLILLLDPNAALKFIGFLDKEGGRSGVQANLIIHRDLLHVHYNSTPSNDLFSDSYTLANLPIPRQ